MAREPIARASIWSRRCALFGLALAGIAVLVIRSRAAEIVAGLAILGAAFAFSLLALLLAGTAIVVIWRTGKRGAGIAVTGLFLGMALLAYPGWLAAKAVRLPVLADVTTDPSDPPNFSRSARALAARNGYTPADPLTETREVQRLAYPNLKPIILDLGATDAFNLVLTAVAASGWTIVEQSPPGGRAGLAHVDAIARTTLLGLPDDLTIRVTPLAGQSRIDVRSASRFGRHDFGTNAARIRAFAAELRDEMDNR